jgi:hypothetical protein
MPPVVQAAEALPGAATAIAERTAIDAIPAFNLNFVRKPISFVGLRG